MSYNDLSTEFVLVLSSKSNHEARRAFFRAATLELDLDAISLTMMDQIAKSIGLMSGIEGGHMFLSPKQLT